MVAKRTAIKKFKRVSCWMLIMIVLLILVWKRRCVCERYLLILLLVTWNSSVRGQERETGC